MHHSVWIIGVIMMMGGVAAILRPDWMKRMMEFFTVRHRFRAAAIAKLVIGIVFLVFARECRIWQVIVAIGILMTAGNLSALLLNAETVRKFMGWWQKQPAWVYRLWGVAAVIFSGIVIYAGIPA